MRLVIKNRSKKGFTLLETLLATAILVIVSSMLMQGFITSMGYSYNSSVYARSASYNSKLCITQLSKWSMYADKAIGYDTTNKKAISLDPTDPDITLRHPYSSVGKYIEDDSTKLKSITFGGGLGEIKVAIYEQKDVNDAVGMENLSNSAFSSEQIKGNGDAYADNRSVFFYYPRVNGTSSDSYFGNTAVYKKSGVKYWGYDDASGNHILTHNMDGTPIATESN